MRLGKIGLVVAMAAVTVAAPAAPAQAQDGEGRYCVRNTDTQLDGQCVLRYEPVCIPFTTTCVEGVAENIDGVLEFIDGAQQLIADTIPDRVCTPTTPFGPPICVTN